LSARHRPDAALFLVGFMGSGKTSAGRALASLLHWDFADIDALVEEELGRTIEAIFRESGEGRFREAERSALCTLAPRERVVVATGGGLFLSVAARAFMRAHGLSCWLDAPLAVVLARAGDDGSRPLLAHDEPLARRAFFERRRAAYALADFRIDAGSRKPEEVAAAVATARRSFLR